MKFFLFEVEIEKAYTISLFGLPLLRIIGYQISVIYEVLNFNYYKLKFSKAKN
jgi:hypothetical protein